MSSPGSSPRSSPGRRLRRSALAVAACAVASVVLTPAAGTAASPPVSAPHVVAHFSLPRGQQPENIALEPDGSADLTFALARQVVRVTRTGRADVIATLPAPRRGSACPVVAAPAMLMGIARDSDGTLYVNYCTGSADLQGIWRIRPGARLVRIAALPPTGLPNGLAVQRRTHDLYATDSLLGVIWRVRATKGSPVVWARGPALARTGFVGANGLKVHGNAVWASNFDRGTLVRIPFRPDGSAGEVQTRATGLATIDDFGFIGRRDTVLAAFVKDNQVAVVYPGGVHRKVLDATDGLSDPTSVAVQGAKIYVPSAAYFTQRDPNLLLAHLRR